MLGAMEYFIKPWEHQLKSIERAKGLQEFAFFYQVGCGKTLSALGTLRHKFEQHKGLLRTLIVGPPIVIENWRAEIYKNTELRSANVGVLYGPGKKRVEQFKKYRSQKDVWVTNFESMLMSDLYMEFSRWHPEVLIVDESHRCKNISAKRTKLIAKLAMQTKYRYLLSGTPILNTPMDVFSQYLILDGGKSFGRNFYIFRSKYFYDKNAHMPRHVHFPNWQVRPGAEAEIKEVMFKKCDYVKKADCLDLPPLVKQKIFVEMSPPQRKAYEQMKDDFLTVMDEGLCSVDLAITKALRLQQIVSGFLPLETTEGVMEHEFTKNPRLDALKEILTDVLPNKVLIWAVFKQNYRVIAELLQNMKVPYVEVHGGITQKRKFENVDKFNNDEDIKVLIGHPGSGGIGINLVSANYSVFYSRDFSLEHDIQAEARNYRGGSERFDKITRIDLVCSSSIDELIEQKLSEKQSMSGRILLNELVKGMGGLTNGGSAT